MWLIETEAANADPPDPSPGCGLTLAACDDSGGPPTSTLRRWDAGRVHVHRGNDPDPDGYLLTVDRVDSLVLDPTGTTQIDLPAGQHTLQLLGVAEHCSVTPATTLEVDVPSGTRQRWPSRSTVR